jgi:hypothetical protein
MVSGAQSVLRNVPIISRYLPIKGIVNLEGREQRQRRAFLEFSFSFAGSVYLYLTSLTPVKL